MAAKVAKAKKLHTAEVYALDGQVTTFNKPKAFFTLAWLQAQVGGSIETVPVGKGLVAVVNEDGHGLGLAPNVACALGFPAATKRFGMLHGPVVVLPACVM
jgi:hypothetical protein